MSWEEIFLPFSSAINLSVSAFISILISITINRCWNSKIFGTIFPVYSSDLLVQDCPPIILIWHFLTHSHIIAQVCNLIRCIYGLWRGILLLVLTELINARMNLSLHSKVMSEGLFEVTVLLKSCSTWSYVTLVSTSSKAVLLNCGRMLESVGDLVWRTDVWAPPLGPWLAWDETWVLIVFEF